MASYNKLEKLKITAYESKDTAPYSKAKAKELELAEAAKKARDDAKQAAKSTSTEQSVLDAIKKAENAAIEAEKQATAATAAAAVPEPSESARTKIANGEFTAMFNPESLSLKYENLYGKNITSIDQFNSASYKLNYVCSNYGDLSLKLILDGTGVDAMGLSKGYAMFKPGMYSMLGELSKPADDKLTLLGQVKHFIDITHTVNASSHEPNDLLVAWGTFSFWCRLVSLDIKYTNFNRDGSPLRAELDIKLISNQTYNYQMMKERKSSPDLTHTRIVKAGDTLPLLTREIYGSPHYYLWVAEQNGLDDIRNLMPGQRLVFPPLAPASGP